MKHHIKLLIMLLSVYNVLLASDLPVGRVESPAPPARPLRPKPPFQVILPLSRAERGSIQRQPIPPRPENSRQIAVRGIGDVSRIDHASQIGDESQIGDGPEIQTHDTLLEAEEDEEASESGSLNGEVSGAYLNELSHTFEDLGELLPGTNGTELPVGESVEDAVVQESWTTRQGRELDFVQGRKYNQLIVDGMLSAMFIACRRQFLIEWALGAHLYNFIRYVQNDYGRSEKLYRCNKRSKGCPAEIVLDGELYVKESRRARPLRQSICHR
jgi:hypothetical protein